MTDKYYLMALGFLTYLEKEKNLDFRFGPEIGILAQLFREIARDTEARNETKD